MKLTSKAFSNEGPLPKKFAWEGENVSPPLEWSEVPEGTKFFALICEDPDAPAMTFTHWLLYDVPGDKRSLEEGTPTEPELPDGSKQGRNNFRRVGYDGPSPPSGPYHRYYFRLYALSGKLDLRAKASTSEVREAMEGKVLASAWTMGRYRRVSLGTFVRAMLRR